VPAGTVRFDVEVERDGAHAPLLSGKTFVENWCDEAGNKKGALAPLLRAVERAAI